MGFFASSSEDRAAKNTQREAKQADKEKRRGEEQHRSKEAAFAKTPAGKARAAKQAGMTIFQIDVPLSKTTGATVAMAGTLSRSTKTEDYANTIQAIEEEGWHLDHVGYIYRITGSTSRDKFLASGQQEAVNGEIVGIYIFRAC